MKYETRLSPPGLPTDVLRASQAATFGPPSGELPASHRSRHKQDPEGRDGRCYARSIKGFIDGAIATDGPAAFGVEAGYGEGKNLACNALLRRAEALAPLARDSLS